MKLPMNTNLALAIFNNNEIKISLQCFLSIIRGWLKNDRVEIHTYRYIRWMSLKCLKACRKERRYIYAEDKRIK